jgi:hypothetical protein
MNVGVGGVGGGIVQKTGVPIMIERRLLRQRNGKKDCNSVTRIQLVMIDVAAQ